jgi:8-amino-7-oxononanoate synthase
MASAFNERLKGIVDRNRRYGRLRRLEPLESSQGSHIKIGQQCLLNFSSNDYLGLSAHPDLRAASVDAIGQFGVGSGGSPLLSGRSRLHDELERRVAKFMGCDRALLFSSGYLANIGVVSALVRRKDHIFHDRLNHASLIDAVTLSRAKSTRYPHLDLDSLRQALEKDDSPARWIITDTIFSMDGDAAPLRDLAVLAKHYGGILIGDDAHGFGINGGGRGSASALGVSQSDMAVQIVTFGKALGTAGAAVVGSEALIESLIQSSRTFTYDTAPPPMIAAATIAALDILSTDASLLQKLESNIAHFKETAMKLPLLPSASPIQPVMIGADSDALAISADLRAAGIYARAIRPPTVPPGTARLRICISASHAKEDIDQLVNNLVPSFVKHGKC